MQGKLERILAGLTRRGPATLAVGVALALGLWAWHVSTRLAIGDLRLQSTLGVDLQFFSEAEEARLVSNLREVLAELGGGEPVSLAEVQALAGQTPRMAQALLRLHERCRVAEERLMLLADGIDADRNPLTGPAPLQPYEEVREFFYQRHNYMAVLDERAEQLFERLHRENATRLAASTSDPAAAGVGADLLALLERHLLETHGITTITTHRQPEGEAGAALMRAFDPAHRTLRVSADLEPGQRAFQIATQIARLDARDLIDSFALHEGFRSDEARALARIGFASYFAGALLLPYGRFLAAAETLRYDIDRLGRSFGVGFETVCHRLSTLQRPAARGVPFFFICIDRAGNISKRQSATHFHFSRVGGTCPLWNVYQAFAQPGAAGLFQGTGPARPRGTHADRDGLQGVRAAGQPAAGISLHRQAAGGRGREPAPGGTVWRRVGHAGQGLAAAARTHRVAQLPKHRDAHWPCVDRVHGLLPAMNPGTRSGGE